MQNTRLNRATSVLLSRVETWLSNPWRRISLIIIGLLFGFFLASAISTIAGQRANLDVIVAAVLMVPLETVSWLAYTRNRPIRESLIVQTLNAIRLGLIYSLFVEAFKLGS
mgnify:CR=1 FL=1